MRPRRSWILLTIGLLATVLVGGSAAAGSDPLTGTWHQRDFGTSNIFYFIDAPVGGVYPIVFYDDWTGVCGDNGPMMWAGFVHETDPDVFEGSFGTYWCPDDGDGSMENPLALQSRWELTIEYHPLTDTITGGIGGCEGTRQASINTVAKAIHELAKGSYPPPDLGGSC